MSWLRYQAIYAPQSTSGAYTLTAAAGAFTLTGNAAGLITTRRVTAATGEYVLSGRDAVLSYSGASVGGATLRRRKPIPVPPLRSEQAEAFRRHLDDLIDPPTPKPPRAKAVPADVAPPAEFGPVAQPEAIDVVAARVQMLRALADRAQDDGTALRLLRQAEEEEDDMLLLLA